MIFNEALPDPAFFAADHINFSGQIIGIRIPVVVLFAYLGQYLF
jgi:hypothetical protein